MSRRRSSSSSPPEPTFFTDRDLGRSVPSFLRESGLRVEAHDDHFGPTTTDVEWLSVVGRKNWVALSRNKRIRYTPLEKKMLMQSGVACFILVGASATHRELAENFVQALPKVLSFLDENDPPFIAKVRRPRKVVPWVTAEEWRKSPT